MRCCTALQWDHYPLSVLAEVDDERMLPPNPFVCHELVQRLTELVSRARIHWRSIPNGFLHSPDHVSLDLPQSLSREMGSSA